MVVDLLAYDSRASPATVEASAARPGHCHATFGEGIGRGQYRCTSQATWPCLHHCHIGHLAGKNPPMQWVRHIVVEVDIRELHLLNDSQTCIPSSVIGYHRLGIEKVVEYTGLWCTAIAAASFVPHKAAAGAAQP
jgi:hypothetical protein